MGVLAHILQAVIFSMYILIVVVSGDMSLKSLVQNHD